MQSRGGELSWNNSGGCFSGTSLSVLNTKILSLFHKPVVLPIGVRGTY